MTTRHIPRAAEHPQRYPHWIALGSMVDQLTAIEEQLCEAGDELNAHRARQARLFVLQIALGVVRTCEEEEAA